MIYVTYHLFSEKYWKNPLKAKKDTKNV